MIPGAILTAATMSVADVAGTVGVYLGVMVAGMTVVGMLWAFPVRGWWREWQRERRFKRTFREDWLGEPPRPGVPARPGVMESLAEMRADWTRTGERLRKVERDLIVLGQRVHWLMTRCRCNPPHHQEADAEAQMRQEDERG